MARDTIELFVFGYRFELERIRQLFRKANGYEWRRAGMIHRTSLVGEDYGPVKKLEGLVKVLLIKTASVERFNELQVGQTRG